MGKSYREVFMIGSTSKYPTIPNYLYQSTLYYESPQKSATWLDIAFVGNLEICPMHALSHQIFTHTCASYYVPYIYFLFRNHLF